LQRDGWRNMLTYAGTIFELTLDDLDFDYLASSRHFHLSSFYLQRGLRPQIPELFRKLKGAGLTISLDTNDDPDDGWEGGLRDALRYVDVLLPNEREARRIARTDNLDTAIALLAETVPLVVIKLGERGAMAQRGSERFSSPPVKVELVDAVGAGDSFDAGFLHQFLRGGDLETCLANGNLAGALSTTRAGGTEAFRDPEHRKRFFETHKSAMK
jgi:sugar/nucleoside kinase (ribokinase family)